MYGKNCKPDVAKYFSDTYMILATEMPDFKMKKIFMIIVDEQLEYELSM